jgi:hypothetical protein
MLSREDHAAVQRETREKVLLRGACLLEKVIRAWPRGREMQQWAWRDGTGCSAPVWARPYMCTAHSATASPEVSTFWEIRRRPAPSEGCRRSTPSGRSRGSSARSGRSQQVIDSAEPNSKTILLRMSQYSIDAYSLISVYILISAYSVISVYILLNFSSFLLIISQFIIILLHVD